MNEEILQQITKMRAEIATMALYYDAPAEHIGRLKSRLGRIEEEANILLQSLAYWREEAVAFEDIVMTVKETKNEEASG